MPTKFELAEYLVNLHNLLTAQDQAGGLTKSTTLLDEYNTNWDLLKETITKENEDETRNRNHRNLNESRTDPSRDQSRRGSTAGNNGDL